MKGSIETTTTVKLELTQDEANWLRGIMQNPLHGQNPSEEVDYDRSMRMLFWNVLNKGVDPINTPAVKPMSEHPDYV